MAKSRQLFCPGAKCVAKDQHNLKTWLKLMSIRCVF